MQTVNGFSIREKKKKIIYRLEHSTTNVGPYQKGWDYDYDRHHDKDHPVPHDDKGISEVMKKKNLKRWEFPKNFFCGFESVDQLVKWFSPKELITLMLRGYIIQAYETKHYIIGEKQAIFILEKSNKVPLEIPYCEIDMVLKN